MITDMVADIVAAMIGISVTDGAAGMTTGTAIRAVVTGAGPGATITTIVMADTTATEAQAMRSRTSASGGLGSGPIR